MRPAAAPRASALSFLTALTPSNMLAHAFQSFRPYASGSGPGLSRSTVYTCTVPAQGRTEEGEIQPAGSGSEPCSPASLNMETHCALHTPQEGHGWSSCSFPAFCSASRPPSSLGTGRQAGSMAASAVIAVAAFSTLGAATLPFPLSYGRFPCSIWGPDDQIHGGELTGCPLPTHGLPSRPRRSRRLTRCRGKADPNLSHP